MWVNVTMNNIVDMKTALPTPLMFKTIMNPTISAFLVKHYTKNRRLCILIGQINLVSPHPKGFKRRGVVYFGNKTRTLRGQKGMVDAGESPRAATVAQFWM